MFSTVKKAVFEMHPYERASKITLADSRSNPQPPMINEIFTCLA